MRPASLRLLLLSLVVIAGNSFHCANQLPPGGGPRDLAPPAILESTPRQSALNVHDRRITLRFDTYVDKRTVQDAFFISPALRGKPEFSWSGRTLEILLPDSLKPHTTYTLSLGTDIVGTRENVHLAAPFTLSFSTGSDLDTGRITGRVHCENTSGVFVFGYRLDGRNADTLNPTHTPPDYLAPVAKDSTFVLPALPDGVYRVVAIRDEQRNQLYDIGADAFAATRGDAVVDAAHRLVPSVTFRLAPPEDTVPPELIGADAVATNHVRLTFSEPIDSTTLAPTRFILIDSIRRSPVIVRSAIPSSRRTSIELYTDLLAPDAVYRCSVDSLRDIAGNLMPRGAAVFLSTALRDTIPPVITWPLRDSARDVNQERFVFRADEPIQRHLAEAGLRLSDSAHPQIRFRSRWINDATLAIYDDHQRDNQWYTLTITVQYFADQQNNHTPDSTLRLHFRTFDRRILGAVKGTLADTATGHHGGYYVNAHNVATRQIFTRYVSEAGPFLIDELPDGTYTIDAFRDDDGNGVCSSGHMVPFHVAEPYLALRNPLRVRARWTVEGVTLTF